ncbi:uncharacterized protein LOC121784156 [Salvia splendens]|uniref:uncharacterized protein LOC121784156 n=1 Tax=Salvia splendens TaxID=180675 RepID=UPI001C256E5A|nr:uncharacterized protein LOC121784156 [Salvia splendens]
MGKSIQAAPFSSVQQPEAVSEPVAEPEAVQEAIAQEPTAVPEETVVPETTTQPEDIQEATTTSPEPTTAGNREDNSDLVTGLELLAMCEPRVDSATEGETPVSVSVSEGVKPVLASEECVERDVLEPSGEVKDFVADVSISEGETPVLEKAVGGEAPIVGEDGGDEALISEQNVEGDTPEKPEGEALDSEISQEPADDGVKLIVDLTEIPQDTDSPVNPRDARRRARRSLIDEIVETVEPTEEESLGLRG